MELLLLFIGAVVWTVIKSLGQPPPKQPPAQQSARQTPPAPSREKSIPLQQEILPAQDYFIEQPETDIEVQSEDWEMEQQPNMLPDDLVRGVIMAEILDKPRSRRPHNFAKR